jgi:Beta-lactamase enzyme family
MDASRSVVAVAAAALVAAVPASAAKPDPAVLQARYDAGRIAEERALARGDGASAARARRDVAWAESFDTRPSGWRLAREVPRFGKPSAARAERRQDARIAAALATVGRSYRGWAAFWYHDLRTGAWAGWNADASFPAASLVKIGAVAAALRTTSRPERSPLWYDLRQLAGWSSNLAANRVVRAVGGEGVVQDALRRLGATASTYPGPYRAGTSVARDAPRPPAHGSWRFTTAHDLGRMLYALNAAAAGNRYVSRVTGLDARKARLALGLLADAHPSAVHGGLIRPFVPATVRVARKEGWLEDLRGTAAIVYGRDPKILVVLVYRPKLPLAEARALARRVVSLTLG